MIKATRRFKGNHIDPSYVWILWGVILRNNHKALQGQRMFCWTLGDAMLAQALDLGPYKV